MNQNALDRAKSLLGRRRFAQAAAILREVVSRDSNPAALSALASSLIELGCYDEAMRAACEALRLDPKFAVGHVVRGHLWTITGDYHKALEAFLCSARIRRQFRRSRRREYTVPAHLLLH